MVPGPSLSPEETMRPLLLPCIAGLLLACSSAQPDPTSPDGSGGQADPGEHGGDPGDAELPGAESEVGPDGPSVARIFPTDSQPAPEWQGCTWASPRAWTDGAGKTWVVVSATSGVVTLVDPDTGAKGAEVAMPFEEGEDPYVLATPLIVGDLAFVAYHTSPTPEGEVSGPRSHTLNDKRLRHRFAVVDLAAGQISGEFPVIDLEAEVPEVGGEEEVEFLPSHALARSEIVRGLEAGDELGRAYVTFGNARDLQPWHGWAFEVDLDAWRGAEDGEEAVSAVLTTTPQADCGQTNASGSTQRTCGGGLWSPTGSLVIQREESYELVLAPGNGYLEPNESSYANTLMKTGPGLTFAHGCDPEACADFDVDSPANACTETCTDLFIPRLLPGQSVPEPADGRCEGLPELFACWEKLDYLGGSTPALIEIEDFRLLAYPAKDGAVYLVDADHLGTLHDREEIAAICGAEGDKCKAFWAGMIVAQPTLTEVDGDPVLLVPTFQFDTTHDAGLVALKVVVDDGSPQLEPLWRFPEGGTPEAVERFRRHTSNVALSTHGPDGAELAWVVEPNSNKGKGQLLAIETESGAPRFDLTLEGKGIRYARPLVLGDAIYVGSCNSDAGPSHLEAYRVSWPGDE